MKHLPCIVFIILALIVLFFLTLTIIYTFPPAGSVARSIASELRTRELKEKFDIQFTLYNGETLSQLIPSVTGKIAQNEHVSKDMKYIYISALYKGVGVTFLTIDIVSPNNPSLAIYNQHLELNGIIRQHVLLCANMPVMHTDEKDVILDYKIKSILTK